MDGSRSRRAVRRAAWRRLRSSQSERAARETSQPKADVRRDRVDAARTLLSYTRSEHVDACPTAAALEWAFADGRIPASDSPETRMPSALRDRRQRRVDARPDCKAGPPRRGWRLVEGRWRLESGHAVPIGGKALRSELFQTAIGVVASPVGAARENSSAGSSTGPCRIDLRLRGQFCCRCHGSLDPYLGNVSIARSMYPEVRSANGAEAIGQSGIRGVHCL